MSSLNTFPCGRLRSRELTAFTGNVGSVKTFPLPRASNRAPFACHAIYTATTTIAHSQPAPSGARGLKFSKRARILGDIFTNQNSTTGALASAATCAKFAILRAEYRPNVVHAPRPSAKQHNRKQNPHRKHPRADVVKIRREIIDGVVHEEAIAHESKNIERQLCGLRVDESHDKLRA